MTAPLRLEYRPLASIRRLPRNPKRHDLAGIHESLDRWKYREPVIIGDVGPEGATEEYLIGGHGRCETLEQSKAQGKEPPRGSLLADDGDWLIPCILGGERFDTIAEAEAAALALNRLTFKGGYDEHKLADLLADLARRGGVGLRGTGHDQDELHRLLKRLGRQDRPAGAEDAPPPPAAPVTKLGDVWILGDHRLLCGDATDPPSVARALAGAQPGLMATDPPWGVRYEGGSGNEKKRATMEGDQDAGLYPRFLPVALAALAPNAAIYLWHAAWEAEEVLRACRVSRLEIRSLIVWRKLKAHFGGWRAQYKQDFEPCLYLVRSTPPAWYGAADERAVWEIEQPSRNEHHPTQKPLELFEAPIRNHTKPGETVFEPFSGSGTQIIAAERTGRRCAAIEISPAYVDVAVERWQQLTGRQAVREAA